MVQPARNLTALIVAPCLLFLLRPTVFVQAHDEAQRSYGPDCSFPIHHHGRLRCPPEYEAFARERQEFYNDFLKSCREFYGDQGHACDEKEEIRIAGNVRQPQSVVNYTQWGFEKLRAPPELMQLLQEHWDRNEHQKFKEDWPVGYSYFNHWRAPTYRVDVLDRRIGGGPELRAKLFTALQSTVEERTGMEIRPVSMYGIRVYTEGAIIVPHTDFFPAVTSCIINVAQDIDEPWPLELYQHETKQAVNITLQPGDMVLFESASVIHGRPFPMKGRHYANMFIRFEPTGRLLGDHTDDYLDDLGDAFYPPYLIPDSPEIENWKKLHPRGWNPPKRQGHAAAASGDMDRLAALSETYPKALFATDSNGWQPIHEAVRSGHQQVLEWLIQQQGVDKDVYTHSGHSPLDLALSLHSADHPVVQYLHRIGAQNKSIAAAAGE